MSDNHVITVADILNHSNKTEGINNSILNDILLSTIKEKKLEHQFNTFLSQLEEVVMDLEVNSDYINFEYLQEYFNWNDYSIRFILESFLKDAL